MLKNSITQVYLAYNTHFNADGSDPGNKKSNEKYVHCNDDPPLKKQPLKHLIFTILLKEPSSQNNIHVLYGINNIIILIYGRERACY